MFRSLLRLRALACVAVALFVLGGCATNGNPQDPLESLNRGVYKLNDVADHLIIKPAAEVYRGLVPAIVRTGVGNFFSNINDVIVALNSLLQGKVTQAALDVSRIVVNTTVGILGIWDPATEMGLEKHNEDFGQTLGYWGIGSGPYLVLPLVGPSSFRDGVGLLADVKADPKSYVDPIRDRNLLWGFYVVHRRSELLDASKVLEVAALDEYEFVRDAYLQRRRNLVYDGNPPDEDEPESRPESKPDSKEKPKPSGSAAPSTAPSAADAGKEVKSTLISGERVPTPAELEERERREAAARAASAPKSRMTRVWLPFSGN
ncbi:MAG TPA: VacJ family lipoprotein [Burkholderiales bacterium]|nr:VacJ family lipoprotein [Burkholderiales bacterium]